MIDVRRRRIVGHGNRLVLGLGELMIKRNVGVVSLALISITVLIGWWRTSLIEASPGTQAGAQERRQYKNIKVILTCDKTHVSLKDDLSMDVAIRNDGSENVYLFQSLHWAQGGGLGPYIKDEKGELIYYNFDPLWPPPLPNDPTLLLRLEEGHFYGIREVRRVKDLVPKPGKYTLFVIFHPIQGRYVVPDKLRDLPVITIEDGPINSNNVEFEVSP